MRRWAWLLGAVTAVALAGSIPLAARTLGGEGDQPGDLPPEFSQWPLEKQALELLERARQERTEAMPRAPKPPEDDLKATPAACPRDLTSFKTGIFGPEEVAGFPGGWTLVNEASVLSASGTPYRIWAGALREDPTQGVLIVLPQAVDPCLAAVTGVPEMQTYTTPFKAGAVTITAVEDDSILFTTAEGVRGRFEYETGLFSSP